MIGFTKEEKEHFNESRERFIFSQNLTNERMGRLIAINFKSKKIIKSKCRKGKVINKKETLRIA